MTKAVIEPPMKSPIVLLRITCQIQPRQNPQFPYVCVYDCDNIRPSPQVETTTKPKVNQRCALEDLCRRCRLNTGNSPKTWIENNVRLKTAVDVSSLEASTVLAINAAFVDREEGNGGVRTELLNCAAVASIVLPRGAAGDTGSMGLLLGV